jgi:2-polyprenyl-3-methyl-5-hydroxy-6-metoxy-1,4-benzoquinol methylase
MAAPNLTSVQFRERKYCPACGEQNRQALYCIKWNYPIVRCQRCGLGSTEVRPEFDPAEIYSKDYFDGHRIDGYADYAGSELVLRKEFRSALRKLKSVGRHSGRLLELGCAFGFFLEEARANYEVFGVEVCEEAVLSCRSRGLAVARGLVSEGLLAGQRPFDVVVMLDVIEHLPDPEEVLQFIYRHLNPGGHVLITTGDWDSGLSRTMKSHWRLMTPPQHLFFFSKRTLSMLLTRAGFRVVKISHPWKLVPFNLILFQIARLVGLTPRVWSVLNDVAVPINLGDAVQVIAIKESNASSQ